MKKKGIILCKFASQLFKYSSKLSWIFLRAPLKVNGATRNMQDNLTGDGDVQIYFYITCVIQFMSPSIHRNKLWLGTIISHQSSHMTSHTTSYHNPTIYAMKKNPLNTGFTHWWRIDLLHNRLTHCGLEKTWLHRTGSTLVHVLAWCRQAPSHYLNQC